MEYDRIIALRNSKTVYKDGENCVKEFKGGYSKADVLNEAMVHARVELCGISVPKIKSVIVDDNSSKIVYEFIEGKNLEQLIYEKPEMSDYYINKMVEIQKGIFDISCPLLGRMKEKLTRNIMAADISATTAYDLLSRLDSMPKHNKLCHGDFNPSNIIITPKDKVYVIDWAHAATGNGACDGAITYMYFCINGKKECGEKYLETFCSKNNVEKKYVQSWLPIVAAARLAKANEQEREFLHSWMNVFHY